MTHRPIDHSEAGFTIIEVLIALALVSVSLVAIGSLMATNVRGVRSLEQHVSLMQTTRTVMTAAIPSHVDLRPGTSAGQTAKGVSLAPEGAELLPKIRVLILNSRDSLPDSSYRSGLCHYVPTVFGRFLEPRLTGFALSALDRQLWRPSSRACMSKLQFLAQALL